MSDGLMSNCPACGFLVEGEATSCRYCGEDFSRQLSRKERRRRKKADPAPVVMSADAPVSTASKASRADTRLRSGVPELEPRSGPPVVLIVFGVLAGLVGTVFVLAILRLV